MKAGRPSVTAGWVAACRSLGAALPADARLCEDPYGARFVGAAAERVVQLAARHPRAASRVLAYGGRLARFVPYIQVRTRALDDVLLDFVRAGGRQVLLLGAGFDCRAVRLREALAGATVFEVDHPATQGRKREVIAGEPSARVEYVPWDFERDAMAALPDRLAASSHDRARTTLTIWEGVTMYLTERAIEDSVAAVRALGAPGSLLAMTYFERTRVKRRAASRLVALAGEPFRFGWEPRELPAWLAARGFELLRDDSAGALGDRMLPAPWAGRLDPRDSHIVVARQR